jgi:NRDE-2, necessary for RNA interference
VASASTDAGRKYQETDGFIPLPSRKSRLIKEDDYRSIGPVKGHDSASDSPSTSAESDSSDDDDEEGGTKFSSYHEKMRSLEEQLSSNPTNASLWLSLLSHSLSQVSMASKNATKVRAEITISILGRSLCSLARGSSTTRIRLLYLHAGEELWTSDKLRQEWEVALAAGDINVFLAWLDWRIRSGSDGVDGILEAAIRVLACITSELERLRVFWRLTCALRQAGMPHLNQLRV